MTWLDRLQGQRLAIGGVEQSPRSNIWNLIGATAAYNAATKAWDITFSGGGGGGTGDVTGPASSVVDRLVLMAGTTGKAIKQASFLISDLILKNGAVAFTSNQSMGGFKLTNVANGTGGSQDAAPVAQVESLISAAISTVADWKQSVRAATTANITLSGAQTIDGVSVIAGDRVLVKNQSTGSQNGIYVAAAGSWARATDADTSVEVTTGLTVVVEEGTANGPGGTAGSNVFMLTTAGPITVNTTALTFSRLGTAQPDGTSVVLSGGLLQRAAFAGGDVTAAAGGNVLTIAAGAVTVAKMAAIAALTVLANATNGSASPTALAFSADGDMLMRTGTALVTAKVANANVATNAAIAGSKIAPAFTANVSVTQPVATSGSPVALTVTGAAHTTLAASTQAPDVDLALARTVQFATGALAAQRAVRITAPTYGFVGASTITDAATVAISGAPVAGTNATITNSYALWIESGNVKLGADTAVAAATAPSVAWYAGNATGTGATTGGSFIFQVGNGATEGNVGALAPNGSVLFSAGRSTAQYVFTVGTSATHTSILNFLNTSPTALTCTIQIQSGNNATGRTLVISGQAANTTGGDVIIASGRGPAATAGSLSLRLGSYINGIVSGGTPYTMFEMKHLGGTQRVTSLNYPGTGGAGLTTTEMPTNTGDLVTFVGDAAAIPSANAVNGYIQYADGGKPGWRFNSTNFRMNGTSGTSSAGAGSALPATVEGYLDVQINGTQRKIPYYAA